MFVLPLGVAVCIAAATLMHGVVMLSLLGVALCIVAATLLYGVVKLGRAACRQRI